MKINGLDIITCGDMKCGKYKDCNKHLELVNNEMCTYLWIPGLDCPEKPEWLRKKYMAEKPPIGPKPYYVWISERIRELAKAISDYADFDGESSKKVKIWTLEIAMLKDVEKALDETRKGD